MILHYACDQCKIREAEYFVNNYNYVADENDWAVSLCRECLLASQTAS